MSALNLTKNNRKYLSLCIKLSLVVLAFWFIFKKVLKNKDLVSFQSYLQEMTTTEITALATILLVLMLVNWGVEIFKWQRLIKKVEQISIWKSLESVFCGLTLAIFTPNRIGEYGGRVFFLSPNRRIVGVVAMAVGNIGQMVVTNIFGIIATLFFLYRFAELDSMVFYIIGIAALGFCVFLGLFCLNIRWIQGLLLSIRWTKKYKKFYKVLGKYSKAELLKLLGFALVRYLVFSTQYIIILKILIPDLLILDTLMMVCILFFVQSSLPSLAIFDIGVRSLAATHFFGYITDQQVAVVASTACIWFVNIIIPAVIGSYFVFKLKLFGNNNS